MLVSTSFRKCTNLACFDNHIGKENNYQVVTFTLSCVFLQTNWGLNANLDNLYLPKSITEVNLVWFPHTPTVYMIFIDTGALPSPFLSTDKFICVRKTLRHIFLCDVHTC